MRCTGGLETGILVALISGALGKAKRHEIGAFFILNHLESSIICHLEGMSALAHCSVPGPLATPLVRR